MSQYLDNIFCPLPWISYAIRNDGHVRVCCHANQGEEHGVLYDNDNNPITYKTEIEETRNCKKLKDIRKLILNNQWHPECIRCRMEHNAGLKSKNNLESKGWNTIINKKIASKLTKPNGEINVKEIPLRAFDLRFGNLCNLKCRMCGPTDSNGWYSDYFKISRHKSVYDLPLIKKDNKVLLKNDPFTWHEDDDFWNDLSKQIHNMKFCYIVGGEPLLIKKHFNFLERCIILDKAKDITIEYNTNLTHVPDYTYNLWNKFKKVRVGVSLDGYGEVSDYIRYPSKFEKIEENLRMIDKMDDNIAMWISCTVMVYNILHLPDYMDWKIQQNFKKLQPIPHRPIFSHHPLHHPNYLNIKMFPKPAKKIIKDMFNEKIKEVQAKSYPSEVIKSYIFILKNYINFMNQEDYSHLKSDFMINVHTLDKMRNQSLGKTMPLLKELLWLY